MCRMDPSSMHKVSVYLSCTQTILAQRFRHFLDMLLSVCCDRKSSSLRCKAMKVLADIGERDAHVLTDPKVHHALEAAFVDDAVSVREAAVDLMARIIKRNDKLACDYFDLIAHATGDAGLSVQRQAVRTMWDVFISPSSSFGKVSLEKCLWQSLMSKDYKVSVCQL